MSRVARVLLGIALLVGAVPAGMYGIFLIGYHDGDGDAYVMLNGGEIDADLVGWIALSVAAAAVIGATLLFRSGNGPGQGGFFRQPS